MNELPSDLALWLFGLDIEVLWNPPRRPQKNGVVKRVLYQLSQYLATRHVDSCGMISIYNRNYYVGERYRGIYVTLMLAPVARTWVIQDARGCELRTHPAEQLTREQIVNLQVYHRRPKPK